MFTILHYGKKKDVGIYHSSYNRIKAGKQCIRPNIMHEGKGEGDTTPTHEKPIEVLTPINTPLGRSQRNLPDYFFLKYSAADNLSNVLLY